MKYVVIEKAKRLQVARNTPTTQKNAKFEGNYNDCLNFIKKSAEKPAKKKADPKKPTPKKPTPKKAATKKAPKS